MRPYPANMRTHPGDGEGQRGGAGFSTRPERGSRKSKLATLDAVPAQQFACSGPDNGLMKLNKQAHKLL